MLERSALAPVEARIAVCTPTTYSQRVSLPWMLDYLRLECPFERHPLVHTHYLVDANREALAEKALALGVTHVLWYDDDVRPAPDALLRALRHHHPLVAGAYMGKQHAVCIGDFVQDDAGRTVVRPVAPPGRGQVVEVDACGFGFLLMDARVLRRLARPWFVYERDGMSEDYAFCRRVKEKLGLRVLVDGDVRLGHEMGMQARPDGSVVPLWEAVGA